MTSCCPPRPMQWNVVTGAIARCKSKSTGYARKRKSVRAWRWTCGVKPTPKAVNKPWQHCIVHGLDKPGVFTTDSIKTLDKIARQTHDLSIFTDGERRYGHLLFELCYDLVHNGKPGRPKKTFKKGVHVRIK